MSYMATIYPWGKRIEVKEGQWLLDAALEAGVPLLYNCRVGACGTCQVRLLSGEVDMTSDVVLSEEEIAEGYILSCRSTLKSDVEILSPSEEEIARQTGTIERLERLASHIIHLSLKLEKPLEYQAGQYALLSFAGLERPRAYSFASAPKPGNFKVDFFIRIVPGGEFTTWLFEKAKEGESLEIAGPFGTFGLRATEKPIIAVAGGSGLAPIKAILEEVAAKGMRRPTWLFFGARRQEELFALNTIAALEKAWAAPFVFVPVLSDEPEASSWRGERGFLHPSISRHTELPKDAEAYLCGPPPMVDAATEALLARGLQKSAIFADKFLDTRDFLHVRKQESYAG